MIIGMSEHYNMVPAILLKYFKKLKCPFIFSQSRENFVDLHLCWAIQKQKAFFQTTSSIFLL